MRRLALALLLLAACRFDPSGLTGGDDVPIDADPDAPDGPPNAIDGGVDADPDAMPDLDEDDDTILDADDNCVAIPNLDQHDEDGDAAGDVCDNCPHIDNPNQADTSEEAAGVEADGIGDDCDPGPDTREVIAVFDPFTGIAAGAPPGWTAIGGSWNVSGDALHQTSTADGSAHLYRTGETWTTMWVAIRTDIDDVPGDDPGGASEPRSSGAMVFFTPTGAVGTGFVCIVYDDVDNTSDTVLLTARQADTGGNSSFDLSPALGTADLAAGQAFVMRAEGGGGAIDCEVSSPTPASLPRTDSTYTSGTVALRTNTVAASFRYVVVFVPAT
jgi:hypothetical protein